MVYPSPLYVLGLFFYRRDIMIIKPKGCYDLLKEDARIYKHIEDVVDAYAAVL